MMKWDNQTDKIEIMPEDEFRKWYFFSFNKEINPQDEFYEFLRIGYSIYHGINQTALRISKQGRIRNDFHFSDEASMNKYLEYEALKRKKNRIDAFIYTGVGIIILLFALFLIFKPNTPLKSFYDNSRKEIIDGKEYLKLRVKKKEEVYELGRDVILANDSTIVIPLIK